MAGASRVILAWFKQANKLFYKLDVPNNFNIKIENKTDIEIIRLDMEK